MGCWVRVGVRGWCWYVGGGLVCEGRVGMTEVIRVSSPMGCQVTRTIRVIWANRVIRAISFKVSSVITVNKVIWVPRFY